MRLVHSLQKTEILKYQIGECNNSLDYMRAAMVAIGEANRIAIVGA